jgi:hypothetical protein
MKSKWRYHELLQNSSLLLFHFLKRDSGAGPEPPLIPSKGTGIFSQQAGVRLAAVAVQAAGGFMPSFVPGESGAGIAGSDIRDGAGGVGEQFHFVLLQPAHDRACIISSINFP